MIIWPKVKKHVNIVMRSMDAAHISARSVLNSGSYYEHPDTGERTYMSSRGKYKVNRVIRDGILVYGVGKHNTGCEFIYMGNENKSKLCDNLYNAPHKIIRIKNPRKV